MVAGGIALIIIGYTLVYSGVSNLTTGGKGWGVFQSLLNKGENTNISLSDFVETIQPQGNSGSPLPAANPSPVSEARPV